MERDYEEIANKLYLYVVKNFDGFGGRDRCVGLIRRELARAF